VTSGSDTREPRPLLRPVVVDLADAAASLTTEPEWQRGDRNSRTIATSDRMRIVLTALRAGATMGSSDMNDTLAIQVIEGGLAVRIDGGDADLGPGHLATVEAPREWEVEATDDSLLLLTVALGGRAGIAHDGAED
jgi:quercetin dioxygenase-like cupin family protein